VSGVNATSATTTFNIQGSAGQNPFNIASSTGANMVTVLQNGSVGINNSLPQHALHVGAGTDTSLEGSATQILATNNGNTVIAVRDSTNNIEGQFATWDGVVSIGSRTAHDLNILSSDSLRIKVLAGGNIGIGTSTPAYTLDIQGTAGVNPFNIASSTGANLMTILQNGSVGIGTANPVRKLDVLGSIRSWDGTNAGIQIGQSSVGSDNSIDALTAGGVTGGIALNLNLNSTGNVTLAQGGGNVGVGTTTPAYRLDIQGTAGVNPFNISSSTGSNLVTVNQSGFVGIGLNNPAYSLDISSPSTLNAGIHVQPSNSIRFAYTSYENGGGKMYVGREGSGGGSLFGGTDPYAGVVGVQGTYPLQFGVNNTVTMTLLSGGNVGIGTTTPGRDLHIYDADGSTELMLERGSNTLAAVNIYKANGVLSSSNVQWESGLLPNSNSYQIQTYDGSVNTSRFSLTNTGFVGIGTSTPAQKLVVAGDARVTGAIFDSANASGTLGMVLQTTGTTTQWVTTSSLGISGGSLSGGTTGKLAVWSSPTTLTSGLLLDNGTVSGVNATSATTTFNIQGSAGVNPFNISSSTGASMVTVTQNGNVGIGEVPASNFKLDITSDTNVNTRVRTTNSGGSALAYLEAGDSGVAGIEFGDVYNDSIGGINYNNVDNSLRFTANAAERLSILNNGNVGIGTTTPASQLTLNTYSSGSNYDGLAIGKVDSVGSPGTTDAEETLGRISFYGSGVASIGGYMQATADRGAWSNGVPTKIEFATANVGETTPSIRMVVARDGFVGIGTSTPTAKLSIQATASTDRLKISAASGVDAMIFDTNNYLKIYDTAGSKYLSLYHDGTNGKLTVSSGALEIGSGGGDLRVYDSAGTNYVQIQHDGTNAVITASSGNVEIGQAGNDVFIGAVGSPSNLVFEESATISGQGGNTITVGINGDIIDLGVSGVTYKVRTLTASGTNLTLNANDTSTTTVVIENTNSTNVARLAVEGSLTVGGTSTAAYNKFGVGTPGQAAIATSGDIYVAGDIEVDGIAYLAGGTAWTSGDFAEEMSIYETEAKAGDVVVINSEYSNIDTGKMYMGKLSQLPNANNILGVISTAPAGTLKYGAYATSGRAVVLTGTAPVKVTTENGNIYRGDLLTTGSLPGSAMKATSTQAGTLGIALEDFTSEGVGYVQTLLNLQNKIGGSVQTNSATTTQIINNNSTSTSSTTINVINNNSTTTIVVIDYEELANIRVAGVANFTGTVKVVDAEFSGRVLVKGDIIVAGDLDLSGAVTTWFWEEVATTTTSTDLQVELGDAVAVAGENTVMPMFANSYEFKPAVGIAVAIKPYTSLTVDDLAEMPTDLQNKYINLISQQASSTGTSTDIIIPATDTELARYRMVKVAISGVVKGYDNLIPGSRYYLALDPEISRSKLVQASNDPAFIDLINQTDSLLQQSEDLTAGAVAGEEEVIDDNLTKVSRTITYQEPAEQDARLQVIGIAKSRSELLIQPSFNFNTYKDGYLQWDFGSLTASTTTSTASTSGINIIPGQPVINQPVIEVIPDVVIDETTTTEPVVENIIAEEVIVEPVVETTNENIPVIEPVNTSSDSNLLQPAGNFLQGSLL
jgi:hypothetical protein